MRWLRDTTLDDEARSTRCVNLLEVDQGMGVNYEWVDEKPMGHLS